MRTPRATTRLACLFAICASIGVSAQQPGYRFPRDGGDRAVAVVSLAGTPEAPRTGDLAVFERRLWLRLDEPGEYAWLDRPTRGVVERSGRVVAANESALLRLDDAAIAALRGVRLTAWSDRIASIVARLPADVPLTVTDAAAVDGRMPQLPSGTRFLWLQPGNRRFDLMHAVALRELRGLRIDGTRRSLIDLASFGEARSLEWLQLVDLQLLDGGALHRSTCLRAFVADRVDVDASWFAMAKQLRHFEVRDGELGALQALAALPELVVLVHDRGRNRAVREDGVEPSPPDLPASGFPKLRRLERRDSRVPVEQVHAFRAAHPACEVRGVVLPELLHERLARADRIVVRSRQRVVLDSVEPGTLRAVTAMLAVRAGDGTRVGPSSNQVIEFFAADARVAEIAVHRDALEWIDGPWGAAGELEPDTRDTLRTWLASLQPPAK